MDQVTTAKSLKPTAQDRKRVLRILAKSVFKELKGSGYDRGSMVTFTNELLELVTSDFRTDAIGDAE